ncbi:MAG: ROK family protein [Candidatus Omnitrophota bacterium]|jgi:glucokinase
MKYAIGVDIGGTKIGVVLGNRNGTLLVRREISTLLNQGARGCLNQLVHTIEGIIRERGMTSRDLLGIGVGTPGAVNSRKGILPRSPNLPGWTNIPLRGILARRFKLPVYLANDANAAALGELMFGAGKSARHFIYITVSTGVGSGIVIDGKLFEGAGFVAGEFGHVSIVPDGLKCHCGRRGCLEAYASGTAIARFYGKSGKKKVEGAKGVGIAARLGDKTAIKSYRKAAYYLGIGIAGLMNVLNPEVIVIGGGVLKSAPAIYWKEMIQSAKSHAWPEAFCSTRVLKSTILDRSGDLGALALVFRNSAPGRT